MQDVLSDRIAHIPDGIDGYRFRISVSVGPSRGIDFIDLKDGFDEGLAIEAAIARVRMEPWYRAHIQGISLVASVERVRGWYADSGYFDAATNRFRIPWDSSVLTFGTDALDVGSAGSPPPKGTYAAKIVRAGLNTGLLCHLRISTPSSVPVRMKKVRTAVETVSELLFSEGISVFSLWRVLHFNAAERGIAPDAETLAIMTGSRS